MQPVEKQACVSVLQLLTEQPVENPPKRPKMPELSRIFDALVDDAYSSSAEFLADVNQVSTSAKVNQLIGRLPSEVRQILTPPSSPQIGSDDKGPKRIKLSVHSKSRDHGTVSPPQTPILNTRKSARLSFDDTGKSVESDAPPPPPKLSINTVKPEKPVKVEPVEKKEDKPPSPLSKPSSSRSCAYCGTKTTPMWRHGPPSCDPLCNSCGVKWARGRILPEHKHWSQISPRKRPNSPKPTSTTRKDRRPIGSSTLASPKKSMKQKQMIEKILKEDPFARTEKQDDYVDNDSLTEDAMSTKSDGNRPFITTRSQSNIQSTFENPAQMHSIKKIANVDLSHPISKNQPYDLVPDYDMLEMDSDEDEPDPRTLSSLARTKYLAARLDRLPIDKLVSVVKLLRKIYGLEMSIALEEGHDVEIDIRDLDDSMWTALCRLLK